MTASSAALVAATLGFAIAIARPIVGLLIDRFFAPRVGLICMLFAAGGVFLLSAGAAGATAATAAVLIGLAIGAEIDLLAYMTSRYFGMKSFGLCYGILFTSFLIGTSVGPLIYGIGYDVFGSYEQVLRACGILLVLAASALLLLPPFDRGATPRAIDPA